MQRVKDGKVLSVEKDRDEDEDNSKGKDKGKDKGKAGIYNAKDLL